MFKLITNSKRTHDLYFCIGHELIDEVMLDAQYFLPIIAEVSSRKHRYERIRYDLEVPTHLAKLSKTTFAEENLRDFLQAAR